MCHAAGLQQQRNLLILELGSGGSSVYDEKHAFVDTCFWLEKIL
jgi:hypothetical protein